MWAAYITCFVPLIGYLSIQLCADAALFTSVGTAPRKWKSYAKILGNTNTDTCFFAFPRPVSVQPTCALISLMTRFTRTPLLPLLLKNMCASSFNTSYDKYNARLSRRICHFQVSCSFLRCITALVETWRPPWKFKNTFPWSCIFVFWGFYVHLHEHLLTSLYELWKPFPQTFNGRDFFLRCWLGAPLFFKNATLSPSISVNLCQQVGNPDGDRRATFPPSEFTSLKHKHNEKVILSLPDEFIWALCSNGPMTTCTVTWAEVKLLWHNLSESPGGKSRDTLSTVRQWDTNCATSWHTTTPATHQDAGRARLPVCWVSLDDFDRTAQTFSLLHIRWGWVGDPQRAGNSCWSVDMIRNSDYSRCRHKDLGNSPLDWREKQEMQGLPYRKLSYAKVYKKILLYHIGIFFFSFWKK